VGSNKPHNGVI